MLAFRAWKEWKKKLKRRRRPVWSLGALAAPVLFMALTGAGRVAYAGVEPDGNGGVGAAGLIDAIDMPGASEASGAFGARGAAGVHAGATEPVNGNRMPADRETEYLVIDERGMLTLTDDPRLRSNAVRTFFQLSIRALEISRPERSGNRLA